MTTQIAAERAAPRNDDELREALARACASNATIAIEGGRTLCGMGAALERADLTLVTTGLDRLLTHEFSDLTCSVQSGMRVAAFSDALSKHGQFVPIDVPLRKKATVGGSLAAGWLGPRRHLYGRARDFVIGCRVALADGTFANAGGMVVKNVSGYDMSKLYVGSFGTLAIFTQVNFKTLPAPPCRRILIAPLPEKTRGRAVAHLAAAASVPAAVLFVEGFRKQVNGDDGIDGRVLILLEGSEAVLSRATLELRSALGRAGVPEAEIVDAGASETFHRVLDACVANLADRSITYRSLGTPSSVEERAAALRDACNARELYTDVLFDAMNGDVFVRVSDRDGRTFAEKIEACHDDLRRIDPRCVIVSGTAPIRSGLEAWGQAPATIEYMRALKMRFDPKRILNRGRFVGGI